MAHIQIDQSYMPLSTWDRESFIQWLEKVAQEVRNGEHFSTAIFTLGPSRRKP